jgi:predicted DNA-binding antitoxin AbrB/MazE fold protein
MSIRAIYQNGVFKPLEDVKVEEGTEADVYLLPEKETRGRPSEKRPRLEDLEAYGIWKDRTDFTDGVDYVNRMRKYRRQQD